MSGHRGSQQSGTRVTEQSAESSDVDELKELQMRTGLVNKKVSKTRMPAIKKPSMGP